MEQVEVEMADGSLYCGKSPVNMLMVCNDFTVQ